MARKKRVTDRDGKVLMRHPDLDAVAAFGPSTVAHHRKAGWVNAGEDDQPSPAGDTGAPSGDSTNPKETA